MVGASVSFIYTLVYVELIILSTFIGAGVSTLGGAGYLYVRSTLGGTLGLFRRD